MLKFGINKCFVTKILILTHSKRCWIIWTLLDDIRVISGEEIKTRSEAIVNLWSLLRIKNYQLF